MTIAIEMPGRDDRQLREDLIRRLGPDIVPETIDDSAADQVAMVIAWKHRPGSLARYRNVQAVYSYGAGADFLLEDTTLDPRISLGRTVGPSLSRQIASYVLASMLPKSLGLPAYHRATREGTWKPASTPRQTTVGLLGIGEMGHGVAKVCRSLGHRVLGWARQSMNTSIHRLYRGQDGLLELACASDFVVCTLPLTPELHGVLNTRLFRAMKPTAWLINVGRGEHLREEDLLDALDTDELAGAVLDVFVDEPLPGNHPFRRHPKIEITPHIAALTDPDEAAERLAGAWYALRDGRPLPDLIDRTRGY